MAKKKPSLLHETVGEFHDKKAQDADLEEHVMQSIDAGNNINSAL